MIKKLFFKPHILPTEGFGHIEMSMTIALSHQQGSRDPNLLRYQQPITLYWALPPFRGILSLKCSLALYFTACAYCLLDQAHISILMFILIKNLKGKPLFIIISSFLIV
jgi:hypothetical protein